VHCDGFDYGKGDGERTASSIDVFPEGVDAMERHSVLQIQGIPIKS